MKALVIISVAVLLIGCEQPVDKWTSDIRDISKVDGLEDCVLRKVHTGDTMLYVTRCPNSSTSTNFRHGKTSLNSATIEDVENTAVSSGGDSTMNIESEVQSKKLTCTQTSVKGVFTCTE